MRVFLSVITICCIFSSCSYMPKPEFKRINKLTLIPNESKAVTVNADAVYFNSSFLNVTVKKLELEVFMEGQKIGEVNQELNIELETNKETIVPIKMELKQEAIAIQLMNSLLNMFSQKPNIFVFKGVSTASVFGINSENPVDFETEIDMSMFNFGKK